jgi:4a-hydroxytetrahydrobiopterin dehydratase
LGGEGRHDIEDLCVPGFSDAVAFIVRISHPLEALDHHPEIRNVYGKVFVGFTTHDQGNKITSLDVRAARAVEGIAARLPQKEIGPKP